MPEPPMVLPTTELKIVSDKISETIQIGGSVRSLARGPFRTRVALTSIGKLMLLLKRSMSLVHVGPSKFSRRSTLQAIADSMR